MLLAQAEINFDKRGRKNRELAFEAILEAERLFHELSDRKMEAHSLLVLSNIQAKRREGQSTRDQAEAAKRAQLLFQQLGDKRNEGHALHGEAAAYIWEGKVAEALAAAER